MPEDRKRLDQALARREQVERDLQRVQGRLDSARETVTGVEEECRKRKVEPDKLDEAIGRLTERYEEAVSNLESDVASAEEQLAPFLGEEAP